MYFILNLHALTDALIKWQRYYELRAIQKADSYIMANKEGQIWAYEAGNGVYETRVESNKAS